MLFPWSIYSFPYNYNYEKLLETACTASLTRLVAPWWSGGWGWAVIVALVSLYLNVAQRVAGFTNIMLSVIGSCIGHRRVGAGGQQDTHKKVEQMEEVNLNFLLSSYGYYPYVLHLPLLFAVLWATWGPMKGILL